MGVIGTKLSIVSLLLRFGLAITFYPLWQIILVYVVKKFHPGVIGMHFWNTAAVNSFALEGLIQLLAISASVLGIIISILLIIGNKARCVALGAALLTFCVCPDHCYSFGYKSPLDYRVLGG